MKTNSYSYFEGAFSSWIAIPFSNFILQLHPQGKHALTPDERLGANSVGILLCLTAVLLIAYFINNNIFLLLWAGYFGLLSIPVSGVFTVPKGRPSRNYLGLYAVGLALAGLLFLYDPLQYDTAAWVFALGIFFYSFVANFVFRYEAKRF